jgi:hypothetical protein
MASGHSASVAAAAVIWLPGEQNLIGWPHTILLGESNSWEPEAQHPDQKNSVAAAAFFYQGGAESYWLATHDSVR